MQYSFVTVNVFTKTKWSGNPLAIVRVPASARDTLTEEQKQTIATEFNLSETVFLHERRDASQPVLYDIFGARTRIPFAGHPTIGTAVYAAAIAGADFPNLRTLHTPLAGDVPVEYDAEAALASVVVPHDLREHEKRLPHPLDESAATNPSGRRDCPIVSIVKGMAFILVPLTDLDALARAPGSIVNPMHTYEGLNLDPGSGWDHGVTNTMYYVDLTGPPPGANEGVHADASKHEWTLRTRVMGRIEDPGTGSASCALCCHLTLGLPEDMGRGPFRFRLVQGVEMGRRNDIFVIVTRAEDGKGVEKVVLEGSAVLCMQGTLEI